MKCGCGNSIRKGIVGKLCHICIWNSNRKRRSTSTGPKKGTKRMITQPESAAVTSVEPKKLTNRQMRKARGLARTYLRNLAKAKKLFEKADNALDALVGFVGPGVTVEVPDRKSKVTTFDNFEGKNSAYRPAKVRKIDVKIDDIE